MNKSIDLCSPLDTYRNLKGVFCDVKINEHRFRMKMDHLPDLYKISKGSILLFNNISKFNFFPNEIFWQSAIWNKIISQDINFGYYLFIIIFMTRTLRYGWKSLVLALKCSLNYSTIVPRWGLDHNAVGIKRCRYKTI